MTTVNNTPYPRPLVANYVLGILVVAYILSFVDRNILSLMVGPIREEFGLSDFQFSILHGWSFTLFYVVLGLPIAWLADRYSRIRIIATGITLWSLMTGLCGLAKSFPALFAARVGVGVGEAALSPAAYSLLADYFPPRRLKYATAIYASGIAIGSGGSFILGGWLFEQYVAMGGLDIPALGLHIKPWQLTFITVGLPGFLIALLLLLVKEPTRQKTALDGDEAAPVKEIIQYLKKHRRAYIGVILGMSTMSVIGYGMLVWLPEFMLRTYGMQKAESGAWLGLIFIGAGTLGTLSGAPMADWLERRGYRDANLRFVALVAAVLAVPATLAPLMPTAAGALLLYAVAQFLQFAHAGVGLAALQLITPSLMRAQVSALFVFSTNLFGLALGGTCIAFFTDFVFGADSALNYSMALTAAIFYPLTAIIVASGLRAYTEAQRAIVGD